MGLMCVISEEEDGVFEQQSYYDAHSIEGIFSLITQTTTLEGNDQREPNELGDSLIHDMFGISQGKGSSTRRKIIQKMRNEHGRTYLNKGQQGMRKMQIVIKDLGQLEPS